MLLSGCMASKENIFALKENPLLFTWQHEWALAIHCSAITDFCWDCRFLLVAGKPIGEPIVQHGPFVMNTKGDSHSLVDLLTGALP